MLSKYGSFDLELINVRRSLMRASDACSLRWRFGASMTSGMEGTTLPAEFSPEDMHRASHALLVQRCALAVHVGSPLYNSGNVRECVKVYEDAVTICMHSKHTPAEVMSIFQDALTESRSFISASRQAWCLRGAIDRVMQIAIAGSPATPDTMGPDGMRHYSGSSGSQPACSGWAAADRASRGAICGPSRDCSSSRASSTSPTSSTSSEDSPREAMQNDQHATTMGCSGWTGAARATRANWFPPNVSSSSSRSRLTCVSSACTQATASSLTIASASEVPHAFEQPPMETGPVLHRPRTRPDAPANGMPGISLLELPEDVGQLVLSKCSARSLANLARTCRSMRLVCLKEGAARMRKCQPKLFRGMVSAADAHPRWLRTLASLEALEAAVGPRPPLASRKWWDEWTELRMAEAAHTGQQPINPTMFGPGGERSIKALLRQYAAGLSWMVDAGWAPLQASAVMLLLACGSAALGHSIRNKSDTFAASAHALFDALRQRAWGISTPAPPTFASIEGIFGLASADPAWCSLLANDVSIGHSFVTSAPIQACLHPSRLPTPDEADFGAAGHGQGQQPHGVGSNGSATFSSLSSPLHRAASAACELRFGGPIVCFLSEVRDLQGDCLRTLIQTSPISYALPPLSRVTLVAMHGPGELHHCSNPLWRRTFCVTVSAEY